MWLNRKHAFCVMLTAIFFPYVRFHPVTACTFSGVDISCVSVFCMRAWAHRAQSASTLQATVMIRLLLYVWFYLPGVAPRLQGFYN
jgi:uncharacterized membrane protein